MDATNTARLHWKTRQRLAWAVERWPEPDRLAWERARQPADFLTEAGAAATWRAASVRATTGAYGRFLAFLDGHGWLDATQSPAERLTPERLGAYVEHLRARCASVSVASAVAHLEMLIKVLAPDADWAWLRRLQARLQRRAEPVRNKRQRVVSSRELLALGWDLMNAAEAGEGTRAEDGGSGADHPLTHDRAVMYRDGLMIALLALCPLRRKNFMALELGRSLIPTGAGYTICFAGRETKTGQPIDHPFPNSLVPALQRYLEHYRPFLLTLSARRASVPPNEEPPGDRLWINRYGQALSGGGALKPIIERTRARFGHPVTPHLFRDCAATTIAEETPARVRMSAAVLGHSDFRTTEAYYIVANTRLAGAGYHDLIQVKRAATSGSASNRATSKISNVKDP